MLFERVAVIGVGLIGGSFALALKEARACGHVVGAGRSPANLRRALELGIIDSTAPDAVAAAHNADLVLLATPVAQLTAGVLVASQEPQASWDLRRVEELTRQGDHAVHYVGLDHGAA